MLKGKAMPVVAAAVLWLALSGCAAQNGEEGEGMAHRFPARAKEEKAVERLEAALAILEGATKTD